MFPESTFPIPIVADDIVSLRCVACDFVPSDCPSAYRGKCVYDIVAPRGDHVFGTDSACFRIMARYIDPVALQTWSRSTRGASTPMLAEGCSGGSEVGPPDGEATPKGGPDRKGRPSWGQATRELDGDEVHVADQHLCECPRTGKPVRNAASRLLSGPGQGSLLRAIGRIAR